MNKPVEETDELLLFDLLNRCRSVFLVGLGVTHEESDFVEQGLGGASTM